MLTALVLRRLSLAALVAATGALSPSPSGPCSRSRRASASVPRSRSPSPWRSGLWGPSRSGRCLTAPSRWLQTCGWARPGPCPGRDVATPTTSRLFGSSTRPCHCWGRARPDALPRRATSTGNGTWNEPRDEILGGRRLDGVTRDRARLPRARGWHVAIDDRGAHGVVAPAEDEYTDALVSDLVHATMLTCLQAAEPGRLELTGPNNARTGLSCSSARHSTCSTPSARQRSRSWTAVPAA